MIPLLLKLRALPWRWIGGAAVVLLAVWQVRAYADRVADAREAEVRAEWAADELAEKQVADAATRAAELQDAADAARNEEIARGYQDQIAAAAADRTRLAGLLRQARIAASAVPASQGPSTGGTADPGTDGSAGPADAQAELDQLIADVIAERRANDSQLNALIAVVVPQMD